MQEEYSKRYENLLKVKGTRRAKIGRGQEFEVLINDILEDEGILLKRGYHVSDNKSEQIDGAIEIHNRTILIEVKWVKKNLAASELYAFIGKVENKLSGTLGLFISKNKLSNNFIKSIVKGRKRRIILYWFSVNWNFSHMS
jgi:Restriction endonuclease